MCFWTCWAFSSRISLIKLSAVVYCLATSAGCLETEIFWRGEGGREGQNGGDGKRKPTNCHSLGRESDKGRDGWEARNPRSQKFIRNPIVSYPESHGIYPIVIRNACGSQIDEKLLPQNLIRNPRLSKKTKVLHFKNVGGLFISGKNVIRNPMEFFISYPESQRCCYWSSNSRS